MSSARQKSSPNWLELPKEITATILQKLGAIDILKSAQSVCVQWRTICKEPLMWTTVDMRKLGDPDVDDDLEKMCRYAVDQSRGGLLNLNIEYFGTDELLHYITERCTQIRRLRFVCCYDVSDEGLCETSAKLPLLEDLELSYCRMSAEALAVVGQRCPSLKSLKLNSQGFRFPHWEYDDEALAIAKSMPELRHLQLFGNKLTNMGLKAILDGCPHLEFLDLRQCFNVNLGGDLGKRCAEQIKDLRRPLDSTEGYEFDASIHDNQYDYPHYFSDIDAFSELEDDDEYQFSGSEDYDEADNYGYFNDQFDYFGAWD